MSMIGNLVALDPDRLQAFIDDPSRLSAFLYPEDGDPEPENQVDLDKAWHAIHFTLNGDAWEGDGPLDTVSASLDRGWAARPRSAGLF